MARPLPPRQVLPQVQPGYLKELLPSQAPLHAEDWDKVMEDVDKIIMPGV